MIETDRLVAGGTTDGRETVLDRAVRPQTLEDYIGQSAVKEQMDIFQNFKFSSVGLQFLVVVFRNFLDSKPISVLGLQLLELV